MHLVILMIWNISEAKRRLGELLDLSAREGPQKIQRRNEAFVVITETQYQVLIGEHPTFKDWLLNGPTFDDVAPLQRDHSPMREI